MKVYINKIKWDYVLGYFSNKKSLFRIYQEDVLKECQNDFVGDIIELGGEKKYDVQHFFESNKVIVSNISRDCDIHVDVTNIQFEDQTVDNYLMISMLQHVNDPFTAISEVKRTLKKGGKLLLVNAFSHPLCDEKDYWRFGEDAYIEFFKDDFEIVKTFYLGGRFSMISNTLRRPIGVWKGKFLLFKIVGFFISVLGIFIERPDKSPIGIGVLVQKK